MALLIMLTRLNKKKKKCDKALVYYVASMRIEDSSYQISADVEPASNQFLNI